MKREDTELVTQNTLNVELDFVFRYSSVSGDPCLEVLPSASFIPDLLRTLTCVFGEKGLGFIY